MSAFMNDNKTHHHTDSSKKNSGGQPFIRRREVTMSCPNGWGGYWEREVSPRIKERICYELWSPEALSRYLDMLKAFGFNSIQTMETTQAYANTGVTREALRPKILHLLKAARERGMTASHIIASNVCYDPEARDPRFPVTRFDLCWHDPVERRILEEHYRYQSEYAPYVDHLVTHWADPGGGKEGCERCNYRGALELHNTILTIFRARNSKIRSTFNTWMLQSSGWNRWPGLNLDSILHSGILAPDAGVAIGLMNCGADGRRLDWAGQLKSEDVAAIRETGRTAGIWGWYTTDMEILPSLHIHTDILQNYFCSLVEPSGGWIDWHTVDDTCHGFNMPNLYVAGRLMQNPGENARELIDEFLHLYFGNEIAPLMAEALRVIEKTRGQSLRYAAQVGDPSEELHNADMRATRELTGKSSWRKDILALAEEAGKRLEHVGIRADHVPPFPTPMPPADYLEEVKAHLRAIAQFMRFLIEADQVWQLLHQKAAPEIVQAAIARLPEVENSSEHLVHLERSMAQRTKNELCKKAQVHAAGV